MSNPFDPFVPASKGLPPSSVTGKQGQVYSENMTDTAWSKTEPLITAEQLRTRHLFGIPLVSRFKDPQTGKPVVMTDPMLTDLIKRGVAMAELEMGIDIFPTTYSEKQPYDKAEYDAFGYIKLNHRPVSSIELLTIRTADNSNVYQVPLQWVEMTNAAHGQINLIPLTLGLVNSNTNLDYPAQNGGGILFLNILGMGNWMPSFWSFEYTTGFPCGQIPIVVNELIGIIAAITVLSQLAATYLYSSASLGIDGLSQSSSVNPNVFLGRLKELTEQRKLVANKMKAYYGLKINSGNV